MTVNVTIDLGYVGGVNYPGGTATIILAGGKRGNLLVVNVSFLGL